VSQAARDILLVRVVCLSKKSKSLMWQISCVEDKGKRKKDNRERERESAKEEL